MLHFATIAHQVALSLPVSLRRAALTPCPSLPPRPLGSNSTRNAWSLTVATLCHCWPVPSLPFRFCPSPLVPPVLPPLSTAATSPSSLAPLLARALATIPFPSVVSPATRYCYLLSTVVTSRHCWPVHSLPFHFCPSSLVPPALPPSSTTAPSLSLQS